MKEMASIPGQRLGVFENSYEECYLHVCNIKCNDHAVSARPEFILALHQFLLTYQAVKKKKLHRDVILKSALAAFV